MPDTRPQLHTNHTEAGYGGNIPPEVMEVRDAQERMVLQPSRRNMCTQIHQPCDSTHEVTRMYLRKTHPDSFFLALCTSGHSTQNGDSLGHYITHFEAPVYRRHEIYPGSVSPRSALHSLVPTRAASYTRVLHVNQKL